MRELQRLAIEHGDLLSSAGRALETVANLLGVDGAEHHLGSADINGLTHAVRAIAGYVEAAGLSIYEAAEMAGALEVTQ